MTTLQPFPCFHCSQLNEVDLSIFDTKDNSNTPTCIECEKATYTGEALTLNDENFTAIISRINLPIIVDFWSIGCAPCKAMLPLYTEVSKAVFPDVILAKLNIETSPKTTEKYDVRGLPTFILFKKGQSNTRKIGAMTSEQLLEWIESVT